MWTDPEFESKDFIVLDKLVALWNARKSNPYFDLDEPAIPRTEIRESTDQELQRIINEALEKLDLVRIDETASVPMAEAISKSHSKLFEAVRTKAIQLESDMKGAGVEGIHERRLREPAEDDASDTTYDEPAEVSQPAPSELRRGPKLR